MKSRHKLIIVMVLILCGGFAARGQSITTDNTSSANGGATNVSSLTWSHTVGSASNRILIVGVALRNSSVTVTSVKYGGISLTFVGAAADSGAHVRVEMWKLVAPASGTASIVVTLSASKRIVAGAVSFSGVNQNTPNGAFTSATSTGSTTASVSVASASGQLVVDVVAPEGDASSVTVGGGQTQRWNTLTGTGSTEVRGASSTEPGAATVTMSWTLGSSKPWAIGAIALKPVPEISLFKAVNPTGTQQPGTDLVYSVTFTNTGTAAASNFVITDGVPANTDFKVGSVSTSLATTGLTVAVAYSNNGGSTYAYTPVSGGGGAASGYDRNVTNIRWTFTGSLSEASPNDNGSVSFTAKIR